MPNPNPRKAMPNPNPRKAMPNLNPRKAMPNPNPNPNPNWGSSLCGIRLAQNDDVDAALVAKLRVAAIVSIGPALAS
eukprot:scaffold130698_cov57-Phaeocystis_antarctica.AAC.2